MKKATRTLGVAGLFGAIIGLTLSTQVSATVIDFEDVAPAGSRIIPVIPYYEDGFRLTSNNANTVEGIFDSAHPNVYNNGTDIFGFCGLCGGVPTISLAAIGGGAFDLLSFEFGTLFQYQVTGEVMSIVGNFGSGGSISITVTLAHAWTTANLAGFTGLSSVTFEGISNVSDLGLDNITVNATMPVPVPVPAPATVALFALGLFGLRLSRLGKA